MMVPMPQDMQEALAGLTAQQARQAWYRGSRIGRARGNREEHALKILYETRLFNTDIHSYVTGNDEYIPWKPLYFYSERIARDLYKRQHHWHHWHSGCMEQVPFEINMEAMALLSATWTTDIFLRKARDRNTPGMRERFEWWCDILVECISITEELIRGTRDYEAEEEWLRVAKRKRGLRTFPRRVRQRLSCYINGLRWGH